MPKNYTLQYNCYGNNVDQRNTEIALRKCNQKFREFQLAI